MANIVWAFAVARRLLGRGRRDIHTSKRAESFEDSGKDHNYIDKELIMALRQAMLDYGGRLDALGAGPSDVDSDASSSRPPAEDDSRAKCKGNLPPRIVHHANGVSVVFKPPDWEVDGRSSCNPQAGRMS